VTKKDKKTGLTREQRLAIQAQAEQCEAHHDRRHEEKAVIVTAKVTELKKQKADKKLQYSLKHSKKTPAPNKPAIEDSRKQVLRQIDQQNKIDVSTKTLQDITVGDADDRYGWYRLGRDKKKRMKHPVKMVKVKVPTPDVPAEVVPAKPAREPRAKKVTDAAEAV
jgi:hypothetical protein